MLKKTRSQRFADALKEWDAFKEKQARLVKAGIITDEERNRRLREKAEELDL